MKELFLETVNGNIPIDQNIVEKYHLHQGMLSPFTHNRIVGRNGEYTPDIEDQPKAGLEGIMEAGQVTSEDIMNGSNGLELSTAEMIDIAQGADSSDD